MTVLARAIGYASDDKHEGAAFSLHVTTTNGSMYVKLIYDDRIVRLVRCDEGFDGVEVFLNPDQVVAVEVIW